MENKCCGECNDYRESISGKIIDRDDGPVYIMMRFVVMC
jgi:hypothetical protein